MTRIAIYLLLLFSLVIGQVVRIPLQPDSSLALRIADVLVAGVSFGWLGIAGWRYFGQRVTPLSKFVTVDKFFLGFQAILLFTFLLNVNRFSATDLTIGFGYLLRLQLYLTLYWVARSWRQSIAPIKLVRYLIWAVVVVAILGIIQLLIFGDFRFMADFGWDPHLGRLVSTFYDPNYVAIFLGIGLLLTTSQLLFTKSHRYWYSAISLLFLITLYFTYSRSGILSTAIVMVILGLRKNWLTGLVIFAIFGAMMFLPGRLGNRFTDIVTGTHLTTGSSGLSLSSSETDTGSQRILSWKRGWAVIRFSPLYGVGYNNFGPASVRQGVRDASQVRTGAAQSTDSSLLTIWATTGVGGLLVFLWFAVDILKRGLSVTREQLAEGRDVWRLGVGLAILGLGIDSTFINSLFYPQFLIFWIFFAGILVSYTSPTTEEKG